MNERQQARRRTDRAIVVMYLWMFAVSAVVTVAIVLVVNRDASTAKTARDSCERAKQLAPAIGDAYAQYHILSPQLLDLYRETIPKSC